MDSSYRRDHLLEMQKWWLDKKINHSPKRIKEFYEAKKGKVYICFSGGKDSSVLLHLVRSLFPEVVGVFSNTTNEYVEILEFVRITENIITVDPIMTFSQTVESFGFPLVSKKVARSIKDLRENKPTTANVRNLYLTGLNRKGQKTPSYKLAKKWYPLFQEATFDITNKCCDILKKDPLQRFEKEFGLSPIIGTQTDEGGYRKDSWINEGCNIIGGNNTDMSRPLSIWKESDIWEYIKRFNVDYSPIYDDLLAEDGSLIVKGEVRTGCAYCGFGAHLEKGDTNRYERLALRKPKQFKKMMNLKNNGATFSEALDFIKVKH